MDSPRTLYSGGWMNKIHNVIWSKVKGCYVVVSELVRFCKHSSTGGGSKQIRALLTAMIMLGGGMSVQAWNPSVIIDHVDSNGNIIANNGYGAFDTDNYLYDYKNPGNLSPGWEENGESIRYGMHSVGGIAIGRWTDIVSETARAGTYQSGIALGDYARAKGSFAVGIGAYSQATDIAAMAIGAAAKATGFNSLAMMRQSAALGTYSTAIGTASWADAESSFALGYSSTALGKQSIAIGAAAKKVSWDDKGTQIGSYVSDGHTEAAADRSFALGTEAKTSVDATDSLAIGTGARTTAANTLAVGTLSKAQDSDALAFGSNATSSGKNALSMGTSSEASGDNSFAIGNTANAEGDGSLALGTKSNAAGEDSFALGRATAAKAERAIAIGSEASASKERTIAIGDTSSVTGDASIAIGVGANVGANNSIALGTNTRVNGPLVNGWSAFTNEMNNNEENGVIAVGNVGMERRIINVAGGEKDTDAVNVKQLRYVNSNLARSIGGDSYTGYEDNGSTYLAPDFSVKGTIYHTVKEAVEAAQTNYYSVNTQVDGDTIGAGSNYSNDGATGSGALAAGLWASATGTDSVAVGRKATANGGGDVAIGYQAGRNATNGSDAADGYTHNVFIGNDAGTDTASYLNVAIGAGAQTKGSKGKEGYMVALGGGAVATDEGSIAIGGMATSQKNAIAVGQSAVAGKSSIAIGYGSQTTAEKTVLLGNLITGSTQANSVVLGNASTDRVATTEHSSTIEGITYGEFAGAGSIKKGVVSVGAPTNERQIINVAAGRIAADSTDAINGSQLYATNTAIGHVANSVVTVMGGEARLGSDGTITTSNIGGTGKDTVHDAIQANKTRIDTNETNISTNAGNIATNSQHITENAGNIATNTQHITDNSRRISENATTISNVNQKVEAGWEIQYDGTKLKDVTPSSRVVNLKAGTNIVLAGEGDAITISTSKEPTFDVVRVGGNTTISGDGVTISGGPSVTKNGIDAGNKKITNVADGTNNSDAVNKGQLDKAKLDVTTNITNTLTTKGINVSGNSGTEAHYNLGETIPIKGEGTKDDSSYSGENIKTIVTTDGTLLVTMDKDITTDSVTAKTVSVEKTVTVGKDGIDGKNGQPGYITIIGQPGKDGANGKPGKNAKADITAIEGKPGVDGTDGLNGKDGITRIQYTDRDKNTHEVATLDDGMKYGGDAGTVIKKKLNEQVNVVGGITDANAFTAEDNLGVVSDGKDTLKVRLAKELKGLTKVTVVDGTNKTEVTPGTIVTSDSNGSTTVNGEGLTTGDTKVTTNGVTNGDTSLTKDGLTISGGPSVTKNGIDAGNQKVTNVADGVENSDAVNKGQLDEAKSDVTTNITNTLTTKGIYVSGNSGNSAHFDLGETIPIKGEGIKDDSSYSGDNIKTVVKDGTLFVMMDKDINATTVTVGKGGVDGKNGQPGYITIIGQPGKDGANGEPGTNARADVTVIEGKPGVNGTDGLNGKDGITRIQYADRDNNTHEVATLDDGMKYGGDAGTVIKKKLNEQVNVVGGITDTNALTAEDNLGVVSDGENNLKVRLAKELKGLTKVTVVDGMNKTEVTPGTIVTTDSNGSTTVNGEGLTTGDTKVTTEGLTTGDTKVTTNGVINGDTSLTKDGLTINDGPSVTKNGIDAGNKKIINVADGTKDSDAVNKGQLDKVAAAANTKVEGSDNIAVDESVDTETKAKTYTVTLKDSITLGTEPEKQISLDGTNGKATVGKVVVDGANGYVTGLTNTEWDVDNPQAVSGRAATEDQLKTVNGKVNTNAEHITNITNTVNAGWEAQVNGTKVKDVTPNSRVLNFNEGKNISVEGNGDTITVKTIDTPSFTSVTTGDTVINTNGVTNGDTSLTKDGLTISGGPSVTKSGIDAGNQKITNVADGTNNSDAVNKGQLDKVAAAANTKVEGSDNIAVDESVDNETKAKTYTVKLKDSITLGTEPEKQISLDGTNGKATVGKVAVDGANGHVTGLTNTEWDVDNPQVVSGRAATEDQLKTVNGKVNTNAEHITNITNTVNAGWEAQVNGTKVKDVTPNSRELNFNEGKNISVEGNGDTITVKTIDTPSFTSVTTGDTVINTNGVTNGDTSLTKDGLTINGGPSVTKNGIDAGGDKITNVAKGEDPTDAVNKSQLDEVAKAAMAANTIVEGSDNITVDESVYNETKAKTYTVKLKDSITLGAEPEKQISLDGTNGKATVGKVAVDGANGHVTGLTNTEWDVDNPQAVSGRAATEDQLKTVNGKVNTNAEHISNITNTVNAGWEAQVNGTKVKDVTPNSRVLNFNEGKNIIVEGNGDTITVKTIDTPSFTSVTTGDTVINTNGVTNGDTSLTKDGLTISGGPSVTKNGIDAGGKKITNVADGVEISDAVNKGQLDKVAAAANTKVEGSDNITVDESVDNETKAKTYTVKLKDNITLGTEPEKQISLDGTNGKAIVGKVAVDGSNGHVTGLTNTEWDVDNPQAASGRAATEDQLKKATSGLTAKGINVSGNSGTQAHFNLGETIPIKGEGTKDDSSYSGENIKTIVKDGTLFVMMDKDINATTVTVGKDGINGKDGQPGSITIIGQPGKDGANGEPGKNAKADITVIEGKPGVDGTNGLNGKDGITRIQYTDRDNNTHEVATLDDGMKYGGDAGTVIKKKLNEQVNVVGGITDTNALTAEDNLGVVSDGENNLKVRLAKELEGLTKVTVVDGTNKTEVTPGTIVTTDSNGSTTVNGEGLTTGDTKVTTEGLTTGDTKVTTNGVTNGDTSLTKDGLTISGGPSVTKSGIDAGGDKITNVAKGENPTDAVNKSQLDDVAKAAMAANTIVEGSDNIAVDESVDTETKAKTYTVTLKDSITLGTEPEKQISLDGTNGKATVGKVVVDGANGYVTGLTNTEWDVDNPQAVSGRAATEDQLKKATSGLTAKGINVSGNSGTQAHFNLGETIPIKGEGTKDDSSYSGENIKTIVKDGTLFVMMDKDINATTVTVGKDGINGKDGQPGSITIIGQPGKDGANGEPGKNAKADITVIEGKPGVDGTNGLNGKDGITRIQYTDRDNNTHEVATLDDGMKYGGDAGTVIKKKLNEQVNVVGGITDANAFTAEDNLGVVSDGKDNLKVRLAKELKGLTKVTVGDGTNKTEVTPGTIVTTDSNGSTTVNGEGLTTGGTKVTTNGVTNGDTSLTKDGLTISGGPSVTKNGIDAGNQKITNVADGTKDSDAVNKGQLDKVAAAANTKVEGSDNIAVDESVDNETKAKTYTVKLKDSITLGSEPEKQISLDGTTGTVSIGAGDKAIVIDAVGSTITAGRVAVDGANGYVTGLTNTEWDVDNPQAVSGRAATEDQLKKATSGLTAKGINVSGNSGTQAHFNLGETIPIKGEGTKDDSSYSGENIKTIVKDGTLFVMMDKDINATTVTVGKDGINGKDGQPGSITIIGQPGKDGANGEPGKNAKADITVIEGKPGVDGTNGLNGKDGITRIQYTDRDNNTHEVATLDDGMKYGGDAGAVIKKKLNEQVNVVGGITDSNAFTAEDNLGVVSDGKNNLKVRLAKELKGLTKVTVVDGANKTEITPGTIVTTDSNGSTTVNGEGLTAGGTKVTTEGLTTGDTKVTTNGVTNGDTSLTKDGLTISGGPAVTKNGIDAGNKKIINVADGTKDSDAVNKGQLDKVAAAANTKVEGSDNIAVDESVDNETKAKTYTVKLKDSITLGSEPEKQISLDGTTGTVSIGAGDKAIVIDAVGSTITAGRVAVDGSNGHVIGLTNTEWDVENPQAVSGRAATEDQLKTVNGKVNTNAEHISNITNAVNAGWEAQVNETKVKDVTPNSRVLNFNEGKNIIVEGNGDTITVKTTDTPSFTTVTTGDTVMDTHGVTIGGTTLTKEGLVTGHTKVTDNGVTIDNTSLTEDGLTISGGPSVTKNGIDAGAKKITNVADGVEKSDAVNKGQLDNEVNAIKTDITNVTNTLTTKGINVSGNSGTQAHFNLGETIPIKGEGTKDDSSYSGENIKTIVTTDGTLLVTMDKDITTDSVTAKTVSVEKTVTVGKDGVDEKNGQPGYITIIGQPGKDGANGEPGTNAKANITVIEGQPGVNGTDGLNGKDGVQGKDGITRIRYTDRDNNTHEVATLDDGMKYGGDAGTVIKKKLNEQVNVVGGITDANAFTAEDNLGVVSDGENNLKVRLAKELKGLAKVTVSDGKRTTDIQPGRIVTETVRANTVQADVVQTGRTTLSDEGIIIRSNEDRSRIGGQSKGNTMNVRLTADGLDNGGNRITNVAPGENGTDAVNVDQLKAATVGIADQLGRLGTEVNRVGAHAAAMAALKPLQYDPLEPTQIMAGIGNYRNETAAAVGIAHYTAEDTMFHMGVSVGAHRNMINAGVTHKFGWSPEKKAIPDRYKSGPISSVYVMQDEVTALKLENQKIRQANERILSEWDALKADNESLRKDNEEMKAVLAAIMIRLGGQ